MSSTTPRRFAAAVATAGAGALALAGTALPATALDTKPDETELVGEFKLSSTVAVDPALSGPERLAQHAEATLEAAAQRSDLSLNQVKDLVEADEAIVAQSGVLSYTDQFGPAEEHAGDLAPAGDVPGDPEGGSRPGAPYTVYLDFDGATVENTEWNREYRVETFDFAPDSAASDPDYVHQVWARVAEDFAPFNINVTTTDPGADALLKTSEDDTEYGMTAVITDSGDPVSDSEASGRAFLGGFGNAFLSPALIFAPELDNNAPWVGNTVSHEVGHTFNLNHDGIDGQDYYGQEQADLESLWGPIMGAPFATPLSQWSPGDYAGATNPDQDDLAEITASDAASRSFVLYRQNGEFWEGSFYCTDAEDPQNPGPGDQVFETGPNPNPNECNPPGAPLDIEFHYGDRSAYADDDHGSVLAEATSLDNESGEFEAAGVVENSEDRDVFALVTSGGEFSVSATPATVGANLDIKLELYDGDGNPMDEDNPTTETDPLSPFNDRAADGLDASLEQDLEAGLYYLRVSGAGQGDPAENTPTDGSGYTAYGSIGNYDLTGSAEPFEAAPITITSPEDSSEVEPSGLEVTGTAEPGAAVALTVGEEAVGDAEADDEGNWSTTVTSDLPAGESTITAQQTVGTIEVPETASVTVSVSIAAPVIVKPEDGDTATTATPTFSGTGVAGATVALMISCGDDFTLDGSAEVDGEGNWAFTPEEALPNGECSVTATQTVNDVTSPETDAVGFTIDVASGDEDGDESGDDDLPDTGASSMNLIALAAGLALLGLGGALYARTRRGVTSS